MTTIVQRGNPVLDKIAEPVSSSEFGKAPLLGILERMSDALTSQKDGVAIAAPQIGVSLRIFVVAGFVFKKEEDTECPPDRVFINPEIISLSKQQRMLEEGCLSVRRFYGKVLRSTKAKIRAHDAEGTRFTLGASGLLAQIFQHEVDHLNGTLFVEHATDLHEVNPDEHQEYLDKIPEAR